jgi:3-hydroxyisobutyrate dehydrogenase-like beta-hydroxyacid dehydrogenase
MGTVAKLANNAVAVGTMALVAEARALARAYGLPEDRLMEILQNASADSFVVRNWPAIAPMWEHVVALGLKDLGTCLDAAGTSGVHMPLTAATAARPWEATVEPD